MTNLTITTETDSDWIGDIPDNWSLEKLKYIFSEKKSTSNSDLQCGSISFGKVIFKNDDKVPDSTKRSYQEVLEGEFLINPLNLNFDLKSLRIGLSKISVVVSQGYIVLKINDGYLPSYYEYLLRKFDVEHMKSLGQGVRQTISFTHIKDEKLVVPPPGEQELISRYLDKKTEQIDSLVEKIQKKIELLKEQRTSLINQCVTKGLDPNVEMKDSGVEWIGEIPSHWDVKKFSYVSRLETGNTPSKTQEDLYFTDDEDGFPWVKPSDLNVGVLGVSGTESRLTEEGKLESRVVPKDSILICCIGNTSGKYSITNTELSINQQINSITFDETVIPRYGLFYMDVFGRDLLKWMNFVTLPIISKGDLSQQPILVPPSKEQGSISDYLDEQMEIYLSIVTKENRRVELLSEYRQSLISSVVTGKVRVTEDMI